MNIFKLNLLKLQIQAFLGKKNEILQPLYHSPWSSILLPTSFVKKIEDKNSNRPILHIVDVEGKPKYKLIDISKLKKVIKSCFVNFCSKSFFIVYDTEYDKNRRSIFKILSRKKQAYIFEFDFHSTFRRTRFNLKS